MDYSQISGYTATNTVSVTTTDLNGIGELLAEIVDLGGNRIDGISFGLQDPETHQDEARILAVRNAFSKAELYADAAGVDVGKVVSISENGFTGAMPYEAIPRVALAQSYVSDVPVSAGEITLTANVSIVFEIDD